MIRTLRIAHTSDVHLHDGRDGERVREAFSRVIDTVLDARSDLFLIAGDLFDHNRIDGDVIEFVYEQLSRLTCPTVIIAKPPLGGALGAQRADFGTRAHVTLLSGSGETGGVPDRTPPCGDAACGPRPRQPPMAGSPTQGSLWHTDSARL
jgi:hypothetical protein